jgi:hypothetical protein
VCPQKTPRAETFLLYDFLLFPEKKQKAFVLLRRRACPQKKPRAEAHLLYDFLLFPEKEAKSVCSLRRREDFTHFSAKPTGGSEDNKELSVKVSMVLG